MRDFWCVRLGPLVLITCVSVPLGAHADWSVTGAVSETVEANDNQQLEAESPGGAVGSITNLSLQAVKEWPTLTWITGTDLGFSKYWGSGANDSLDGFRRQSDYRLSIRLHRSRTTMHHSTEVCCPRPLSEVFDSGVTNADTTTFTYGGQGSLTHQLNSLNAIGLVRIWEFAKLQQRWPIGFRDQ